MNTHQSGDASRDLTAAEVEAALHVALRDEGILLPKTIEDIAELEATLDLSGVPTPDPRAFSVKLRAATGDPKVVAFTTPKTGPAKNENLALAARNGSTLSEETRRKMDQLRAKYEAKSVRPEDGQK
jgi:hypothetical protein